MCRLLGKKKSAFSSTLWLDGGGRMLRIFVVIKRNLKNMHIL